MSYFKEIVLPSVDVPEKSSYSVEEAIRILDTDNNETLDQIAHKWHLKIVDNRIEYAEFERFFEQ